MENYFVYLIVVLVIAFVLFLILRELNCWYWKINKRISLMEQQNDLLLKILRKVDNANEFEMSPKITEIRNPESNTRKEKNLNNKTNIIYEHLSESEKKRADEFISHGIKEGQVLAINKTTREIDRFDHNEWEKMVSKAEDFDWMIIVQK